MGMNGEKKHLSAPGRGERVRRQRRQADFWKKRKKGDNESANVERRKAAFQNIGNRVCCDPVAGKGPSGEKYYKEGMRKVLGGEAAIKFGESTS